MSPRSFNAPHFFKVILEHAIREGKLGIPKKFVRLYGKFLPSPIILKDPTGKTWRVELLNDGNGIWLQKGWQEFADHHSLKNRYFLVFKYEGDRNFSVMIFDTSAVEIEYANSGEPQLQEPGNQERHQDGAMMPIIIEDSDCSDKEFVGNRFTRSKMNNIKGKQARRSSHSSVSSALKAATKFTSSYPFFRAEFRNRQSQNIPIDFIRKHMYHTAPPTVLLKVEDKSWSVSMRIYFKKSFGAFYSGWHKFVDAHSLKERDVCVFEMIKSNIFNVHIFKSGHH